MKRLKKQLLFYSSFAFICGFMVLIYTFDPRINSMDLSSESVQTVNTLIMASTSPLSPPTFDTPETCDPNRNYMEDSLKAFAAVDPHGYFTQNRTGDLLAKADVPKACVLYAMKNFENISEHGPSRAFAECASEKQLPKSGMYKPCVDEAYVDLVYNSFIDVASCMGLPQKMMTAKLMNESGFHINAFSALNKKSDTVTLGGDAGVAQLTSQAIQDAKLTLDQHISAINRATDDACKRVSGMLRTFPSKETLSDDINQRCQVIFAPPNPLFNLLLYSIVYKNNKASIDTLWSRPEASTSVLEEAERDRDTAALAALWEQTESIQSLMTKAKIDDLNKDKIKEMLIILAYNAGPKRAVRLLKLWLHYRLNTVQIHQIVKADFDFGLPFNKDLAGMKDTDVDKLLAEEAAIAKDPAQAQRLAYLQSLGIDQINLPTYLRLYRQVGTKAYLTEVKNAAVSLDKGFGKGVCTEQPFLAL